MKKTFFFFLLLSQVNCPMLSIVKTMITNLANTIEDGLYLSDDGDSQPFNDMALHFEKIKRRKQASLLADKNSEAIKRCCFQKMKKYCDEKKEERRYKQVILLLKKARNSIQNNAKLRSTIEHRIAEKQNRLNQKKRNILESQKSGFIYVSESDLLAMEFSNKKKS